MFDAMETRREISITDQIFEKTSEFETKTQTKKIESSQINHHHCIINNPLLDILEYTYLPTK